MTKAQVLPFSLLEFIDAVDREFAFLKTEWAMVEDSSEHTSHVHTPSSPFGFGESVFATAPIIRFSSARAKVTIAHDPRGAVEVFVRSMEPPFRSISVQELAQLAAAPDVGKYGEIYDATAETAAAPLHRLAAGIRQYAPDWVKPITGAV